MGHEILALSPHYIRICGVKGGGFLDSFRHKGILHLLIRTCSMLRAYVTRKGKGRKAPWMRGVAALSTKVHVNKRRAVDYRVSNWSIRVESRMFASMQLSSTTEGRGPIDRNRGALTSNL